MPTQKQILANRRNAMSRKAVRPYPRNVLRGENASGRGPRTAEGKSISRLNALRHGLTAQIDVRTPEDQQAHDDFCVAIIASLKPEGAIEQQFAQFIADDHWRLNRARTLENNIFAIAATFQNSDEEAELSDLDTALADARTYIADPGRLNLLSLYERRIHGNMTRSLKQLIELQTQRRKSEAESNAARTKALAEEILLAQLAEAEGIQYVPAPSGFAFSTPEILAAAHRQSRLEAAKRVQTAPHPTPVRRAA